MSIRDLRSNPRAKKILHPFLLSALCLLLSFVLINTAWAQDSLWLDAPDGPRHKRAISEDSFASVVEMIIPSVVSIEIKGDLHRHGPTDTPHNKRSNGTGFIINRQGHVITNQHVIDGAIEISVIFHDKTRVTASLIAADEESDLALLQLPADAPSAPPIPLGDSEKIRIGQWTLAIGNPLGLSGTVTAGIISARGRTGVHPGKQFRSGGFIQTDASINKGNSGGPLVDRNGAVIAVTTAMKGKAQGIAFAIPINMVKRILPQLASGKVERAWMGIRYGEVSAETAKRAGLKTQKGAHVINVEPEGPAANGGILPGDIVLSIDEFLVETHSDLGWLARTAPIGEETVVALWRNGKPTTQVVIPQRRPEQDIGDTLPTDPASLLRLWGIGVDIEAVDSTMIHTVQPGGVGQRSGLQAGDRIVRVNQHASAGSASFFALVKETTGDVVELEVLRSEKKLYIPLLFRDNPDKEKGR